MTEETIDKIKEIGFIECEKDMLIEYSRRYDFEYIEYYDTEKGKWRNFIKLK